MRVGEVTATHAYAPREAVHFLQKMSDIVGFALKKTFEFDRILQNLEVNFPMLF
jgi:hypothetical protein